jgi:hypothetical protein
VAVLLAAEDTAGGISENTRPTPATAAASRIIS